MKKISDGTNYIDIIKKINARITTYNEVIENNFTDRVMVIRHDVDQTMESAIALANHEYKHGIRSIYFLLDSRDYFNNSLKFKNQCKRLIDLGHFIGWHNNTVVDHIKTGKNFKDLIEKSLSILRNNNLNIEFVAAHGGRYLSSNKIRNDIIWNINPTVFTIKWCNKKDYYKKGDKVSVPSFKLSDFNLKSSVSSIPKNSFIGDGCGQIRSQFYPNKKQIKTNINKNYKEVEDKVINRFNKLQKGYIEFLAHPHWWK